MNENFNQVNNNENTSFTDYQANQPVQPAQQNITPVQNQYDNSSYVYNDEGNQAFNQKDNRGIIKTILIIFGIIIIIIIILLLLKFCGGGKLTGIKLTGGINANDELITYVDEKRDIEASTIGSGDRSKTVFTFKIDDDDIAEIDNDEQIGDIVENEVKGLKVGQTTLNIEAELGKNKFEKEVTVVVCDRLDVSGIAENTINVKVSETKKLELNLGDDSRCYAMISTTFGTEGIATIDDDLNITGITGGTTTLVISDGENEKEFTVVVTDPNAVVLATSLTVKPTVVTLVVGKTKQIKPTIKPVNATNKSVSYSSSKPSVATVSQTGVIKARAVGKATITVMALDGSDKTAIVTVNVVKASTPTPTTDKTIAVTSIEFAQASYSTTVGAKVTAGVVFKPTNATNKTLKSCVSDNTKITTAIVNGNSCIVTGVAAGETILTATSTDGGKTATTKITVTGSTPPDNGGAGKCYCCGSSQGCNYIWSTTGAPSAQCAIDTTKTKTTCTGSNKSTYSYIKCATANIMNVQNTCPSGYKYISSNCSSKITGSCTCVNKTTHIRKAGTCGNNGACNCQTGFVVISGMNSCASTISGYITCRK
ncbi:MAG TPA: Ig-like domain-containing protein [Bacilli bacterium]|nr:Ig-like domain-containing protein [Bacilli bacterium]